MYLVISLYLENNFNKTIINIPVYSNNAHEANINLS